MALTGIALSCPKCRADLGWGIFEGVQTGTCRACQTAFEFRPFPALRAETAKAVARAAITDDAVCFFHVENTADAVCDSCGRFLCTVCAINFTGKKLCPSCIAISKNTDTKAIDSRVLYEGIALTLALLPLLLWPFTIITAPAALGFAITGWRRPGSLVGKSHARLIIAAVVASVQIAAWLLLLVNLLFHPWGKFHFPKH